MGLEFENRMIHHDVVHENAIAADPAKLNLPVAPASEPGPVKAWEEAVVMQSYVAAAPDRNPLFLEKRVYQGSSGRVYPLPVVDRIETEPQPHAWRAIHLENEFLRFMVLPEIGGRIHVGLDKRNDYDFFYRQNVIKPALVGLAGPWASGGVELNWPQHHRPATFMSVEVSIDRDADGSVTVWCSDHDPMARMKGMHGLCLRPGKAYLELRVRLYNRTTDTQTFLWWANVATRVHERYQSFFPHDVHFAADHAKRALTEYPLSKGKYYGVDYGSRALHGVPEDEKPSHFMPDGSYPPNDLGWYANIPVPTSYMVGSLDDYFGGYDHAHQAGLVHIANHHISPGKKQWTWGNHDFGYAWDRNLTDADGPYIELMAGVYTDNQPDFSFLAPGETKTFSQFWYPISQIGVPDRANIDAALRVQREDSRLILHLQVTSERPQSTVRLRLGGKEVGIWRGNLHPEMPLHHSFATSDTSGDLEVTLEQAGQVLLRYAPAEIVPADPPDVATEPPLPAETKTADELFLTGVHLEQYRHPTRYPEPYWREALQRDPSDSRCNHALGRWHLRRGEFQEAGQHLRAAIGRLTERNPNPYDGEPHYNLGLTLLYQQRSAEAYAAFYKSTWNAAWRGPAYHRLAEIDSNRQEWAVALDHIDRSLRADADNLNARNLKTAILRRLGKDADADALLSETRALDPLDIFSRLLATGETPEDGRQRLDLAFDLERAGLLQEALEMLSTAHPSAKDGTVALLLYVKAHLLQRLGRNEESNAMRQQATTADPDYVFPSRIEEILLLEEAIRENPGDARAPYYLGNLLYDRRRHAEAISMWQQATALCPQFPTAWRNLGFGYYNIVHDRERALHAFERARDLAPGDARILYEQDQLRKRVGHLLHDRLDTLEQHLNLVERRDDLSLEIASLYNSTGRPDLALAGLLARRFQPWEGGEGLVLGQYVRANLLLAQDALAAKQPREALVLLHAASNPPHSLSEAKHLLMNLSMIDYWFGVAYEANGQAEEAAAHWRRAAKSRGDFQQMQVRTISEMTYWSAMALLKLGKQDEARTLFGQIYDYAEQLEKQTPRIDYFATSLPAMLLFEENLRERQTITALFLQAQALLELSEEGRGAGMYLLRQVLERDCSHAGAIDSMRRHERP
jgi:tetratricopeptide (TPR) repeat protein